MFVDERRDEEPAKDGGVIRLQLHSHLVRNAIAAGNDAANKQLQSLRGKKFASGAETEFARTRDRLMSHAATAVAGFSPLGALFTTVSAESPTPARPCC
jgi:hypothetical protein